VPEYRVPGQGEVISSTVISIEEHERRSREKAERILGRLTVHAQEAGIDCDSDFVQSDHPYQAIIEAAERHGCDLILMALHGRHGLAALVYGSETREVLAHSSIPTLVYR
jgi:nucleotide-binding universal stress UspA family protein